MPGAWWSPGVARGPWRVRVDGGGDARVPAGGRPSDTHLCSKATSTASELLIKCRPLAGTRRRCSTAASAGAWARPWATSWAWRPRASASACSWATAASRSAPRWAPLPPHGERCSRECVGGVHVSCQTTGDTDSTSEDSQALGTTAWLVCIACPSSGMTRSLHRSDQSCMQDKMSLMPAAGFEGGCQAPAARP